MGRGAGKRMVFSVGAPAGHAKSGRNKQPPRSASAATGRKGSGKAREEATDFADFADEKPIRNSETQEKLIRY